MPAITDPAEVPEGAGISGDGRYVVYEEIRLGIAPGPAVDPGSSDRDQDAARCQLDMEPPRMTAERIQPSIRTVPVMALRSLATNLVAGDTNALADIFVTAPAGQCGPALPGMTLDKTSLRFAAVTNGASLLSQTRRSVVRLLQSGNGQRDVDDGLWNQPWLQVPAPARFGDLSISVPAAGLPPSGTVTGTIVDLADRRLQPTGADRRQPHADARRHVCAPVGTVDTPLDFRTGVTGAVPFTGWAVDDVGVERVTVCRAATGRVRRSTRTAVARRRSSSAMRCSSTARGRTWRRRFRPAPQHAGGVGLHGPDEHAAEAGQRHVRVLDLGAGPGGPAPCWDAHDDVRECERGPAVRRHRHAGAGGNGVGQRVCQLRLGADAASRRRFRPTARRLRCSSMAAPSATPTTATRERTSSACSLDWPTPAAPSASGCSTRAHSPTACTLSPGW